MSSQEDKSFASSRLIAVVIDSQNDSTPEQSSTEQQDVTPRSEEQSRDVTERALESFLFTWNAKLTRANLL